MNLITSIINFMKSVRDQIVKYRDNRDIRGT